MNIYKFTLRSSFEPQSLRIHDEAQFLSVGNQREQLRTWWLVDTEEAALVTKTLVIRPTGQPIVGDIGTFLGTVLLFDGNTVLHVFEL